MKRLTLTMVSRGASAESLRAARPTSVEPSGRYLTTLGKSVLPSSTGRLRGLPESVAPSARTTATSELVVPRSMPTARVGHACFILDSPGSAISKSATSRSRGAPLDLVEIARVVAQLRDELGDGGQVGLRAALEGAKLLRDVRERRVAPPLDLAGEHLDRLRFAPTLGLEQLLAVLQRLREELGRQLHLAPLAHLHAPQLEQMLRAPHRILERAVGIVEQRGLLEREPALLRAGAREAVWVQLAGERLECLLHLARMQVVRARESQRRELVRHGVLECLLRGHRLHLAAVRAERVACCVLFAAAPALGGFACHCEPRAGL